MVITPENYVLNIILAGYYTLGKTDFAFLSLNTHHNESNCVSKISKSFPNVLTKDYKTFILNGTSREVDNTSFSLTNMLGGESKYEIVDGLVDEDEYEKLPFV